MLINVHSYYSLRYGTIALENLVPLLRSYGYDTAVLTDITNTTAVLDFIRYCRGWNFKGLAGVEYRNGDQLLYICIARNNAGFRELNQLLTDSNLKKTPYPFPAPRFDNVYVIYPFGSRLPDDLLENEYIGIKPGQLGKLFRVPVKQQQRLVIWQPVTMSHINDFRLHCELRAIDHNIVLSKLQPHQAAGRDEVLPLKAALLQAYSEYSHIIAATERLLAACSFDFDFSVVKNKKHFLSGRYEDRLFLERLAAEGLIWRYGKDHAVAKARVAHELEIIDQLGFSAYFLITWDMIRFSSHKGYPHVGRGSGANSIVAYCLGITNVCPIRLDLYFERFLNPSRKTPPDFDIDYSHADREYIFKYMFDKYGPAHTAMLGTIGTFKDRSIIQEIGKVYGLPDFERKRLIEEPWAAANDNEIVMKVLKTFARLPEDFPNLRSVHAGGVLITEEPLVCYTALDMPPMGFGTTQFDMYTAEKIGCEKLDILSQRGMSNIKECVKSVKETTGESIEINDVEKMITDPVSNVLLAKGQALGCFYIESPSMRGVLRKLKCQDYITLVAASSIIRPGVGRSGMMDTFISRYHNPTGFQYLHPILEQQLKETFGVMIYQEDVLKVAHYYGGLTLEQADSLRRLMSGKTRGADHQLPAIQEQFFLNTATQNFDVAITTEIWRQMASFAGYSFSKAHSASYAIESYQCLYLKAHYPLNYMIAVINNQGGFYSPRIYIQEARRLGGNIQLPCINLSQAGASLHGGCDIYLGLTMIYSLNTATMEAVLEVRARRGPYKSLEDFVERVNAGIEQLQLLIRAGAFRFTGQDKKTLLWKSHFLLQPHASTVQADKLLGVQRKNLQLPPFDFSSDEDFYDEMELLHFPVSVTYFDMLKTTYRGDVRAKDLAGFIGQTVRVVGNYVCEKKLLTKKKEPMSFGTFYDADFDFLDTVHFSDSLRHSPLQGAGTYLIQAKVTSSYGHISLMVERMAKLPIRSDPRMTE